MKGQKMEKYVRPVVLANEELAEGVYAASGTGVVSAASVTLETEGNQYYKVNTYKVTIVNSGSEPSSDWTVVLSVTSGTATEAKTYDTWTANASLNGSAITIEPGSGGTIPAGDKIELIIAVSYNSDSVTVQ